MKDPVLKEEKAYIIVETNNDGVKRYLAVSNSKHFARGYRDGSWTPEMNITIEEAPLFYLTEE